MGPRRTRFPGALLTALAAAMLALPVTAAVAQPDQTPPPYPPGEGDLDCDRTAGTTDDSPFCEGHGFAPGVHVTVTATPGGSCASGHTTGDPVFSTTTSSDAQGIAAASIDFPDNARPGRYLIQFVGPVPSGGEQTLCVNYQLRPRHGPPGGSAGAAGQVSGDVPGQDVAPAPDAGEPAEVLGASQQRLAATGLDLTRGVVLVGLLIAAGLALLHLTRRSGHRADAE